MFDEVTVGSVVGDAGVLLEVFGPLVPVLLGFGAAVLLWSWVVDNVRAIGGLRETYHYMRGGHAEWKHYQNRTGDRWSKYRDYGKDGGDW